MVNDASTHVNKVIISYSGWRGRSGSVTVSSSPGWEISGRSFNASANTLTEAWTFQGTFGSNGSSASGTWRVVIGNQNESGSWQATPK